MAKKTYEERLAAKVAARQKFIEDIIRFVATVVVKKGTQLKQRIHDYYTYSENELKGFSGFSFYAEGTYSMYGGESARVWYHPKTQEAKSEDLVLQIDWHDAAKCVVKRFDESLEWQKALKKILRNEDRHVRNKEKQDKEAREQKRRQTEIEVARRRARADIEANAERLNIRLS